MLARRQEAAAEAERSGGLSRVRCSWNQSATATGRLSSSAPNLQVEMPKALIGIDLNPKG